MVLHFLYSHHSHLNGFPVDFSGKDADSIFPQPVPLCLRESDLDASLETNC